MTRSEYRQYQSSVDSFLSAEGIESSFTCDSHDDESRDDHVDEFSWHPCDCCRSPLGGERHRVTAYHPATKEILTYQVCPDCVYYVEYGQLDDMTMMDMDPVQVDA